MKHMVRLAEIYNYSHCKLVRNKRHAWKSQENELLVHVSRNKVHTVQMLRLHIPSQYAWFVNRKKNDVTISCFKYSSYV